MKNICRCRTRTHLMVAGLCLIMLGAFACDERNSDAEDEEASQEESSEETSADEESADDESATDDAPATDDEDAKGDDETLTSLEDHFPDRAVVLAIESLDEFLETSSDVIDAPTVPAQVRVAWQTDLDDLREEFREAAGDEFPELDEWRDWGIAPGEEVLFGFLEPEEVLIGCLPLDDREVFHEFAVEIIASAGFGAEDSLHEERVVDGQTIHTATSEWAWAYLDNTACTVIDDIEGNAEEFLVEFLSVPSEGDSLGGHRGYTDFSDSDFADRLFVLFTQEDLGFLHGLLLGYLGHEPPEEMVRRVESAFTGFGAGVGIEDDVLETGLWMGLHEVFLNVATRVVDVEHTVDWRRFSTDDTTAALRLTMNPQNIWELFRSHADDATLREVDEVVAAFAMITGGSMDLEDDIIGNLSGQIGAFVYGDGGVEALLTEDAARMEEELKAVVAIQFIDEERFETSIAELVGALSMMDLDLDYRKLDDADGTTSDEIHLLGDDDEMVRFYHTDDLLVMATKAVPETKVASLLEGEYSEASPSKTDAALDEALYQERVNGLYVSASALEEWRRFYHVDHTAPVDEMMFWFDVTDTGVALGADIAPAGAASALVYEIDWD